MQSDNGVSGYLKYPKLLKQLVKSAQIYLDTHPHVRAVEKFSTAYNVVFHNLFCDFYEEYKNAIDGGLFPELGIDAKAYLEEYFKIDLTV